MLAFLIAQNKMFLNVSACNSSMKQILPENAYHGMYSGDYFKVIPF